MEPIVVHRPAASVVKLALSGLLILAAGVWLVAAPPEKYPRLVTLLLGVVVLALALLSLVHLARQWPKRREPVLVIDADGFDDRTSGVSAGRVPWSDVTGIEQGSIQGQRHIAVRVTDPEPYLARLGSAQRLAARKNLDMVGTPVCPAASGMDRSADEIVAAMEQARAQYGRRA